MSSSVATTPTSTSASASSKTTLTRSKSDRLVTASGTGTGTVTGRSTSSYSPRISLNEVSPKLASSGNSSVLPSTSTSTTRPTSTRAKDRPTVPHRHTTQHDIPSSHHYQSQSQSEREQHRPLHHSPHHQRERERERGPRRGESPRACIGCLESIANEGKVTIKRRKAYCGRCVQAGIKSHAEATRILTAQLEASRGRSYAILGPGPGPDSHSVSVQVPLGLGLGGSGGVGRDGTGRNVGGALSSTSTRPGSMGRMVISDRDRVRSAALSSTSTSTKTSTRQGHTHPHGLVCQINLLATHHSLHTTFHTIQTELARLKSRNDSMREGLRGRRDEVLKRRAGLVLGRGRVIEREDRGWVNEGGSREGGRTVGCGLERLALVRGKKEYLETTPHAELSRIRKENLEVQARLIHARKVLVKEVIEVMGIRGRDTAREVGTEKGKGKASVTTKDGEKARTKNMGKEKEKESWEIASLPFLFPRDQSANMVSPLGHSSSASGKPLPAPTSNFTTKRSSTCTSTPTLTSSPSLPPHYHNALLGHVVHALTLISTYLDVMLPFEPTWNDKVAGSRAHVGKVYLSTRGTLPFIVPVAPSASLSNPSSSSAVQREKAKAEEAMWRKEGVLYVSTGREKWTKRMKSEGNDGTALVGSIGRGKSRNVPGPKDMTSELVQDAKPIDPGISATPSMAAVSTLTFGGRDKHQEKEDQLVLAYTMLTMNVAYLSITQGVDLEVAGLKQGDGGADDGVVYAYALEDLGSVLKHLVAIGESDGLGSASHLPSATQLRCIALPVNLTDLHDQMKRAFSGQTVCEGEGRDMKPTRLEASVEDEGWDVL